MAKLSAGQVAQMQAARDLMADEKKPYANYIDFSGIVIPAATVEGLTANSQVTDFLSETEATPYLYPLPAKVAGLLELFQANADTPFSTLDNFITALRAQADLNQIPYCSGKNLADIVDLLIVGIDVV